MAIGVVWDTVVVVGGAFGMYENLEQSKSLGVSGCIATGPGTANSLVPSYLKR